VLRDLNKRYMENPEIVNILHAHTICALSIKHKIYDGELLMVLVELLNFHGVAITMSECLARAVTHFI